MPPKYVLLENVMAFLSSQSLAQILAVLTERGFQWQARLIFLTSSVLIHCLQCIRVVIALMPSHSTSQEQVASSSSLGGLHPRSKSLL